MITKDNFIQALEALDFQRVDNSLVWSKCFGSLDCVMEANLHENKPSYPVEIGADSETSQDFSKPESFVVFICIAMLLEKG